MTLNHLINFSNIVIGGICLRRRDDLLNGRNVLFQGVCDRCSILPFTELFVYFFDQSDHASFFAGHLQSLCFIIFRDTHILHLNVGFQFSMKKRKADGLPPTLMRVMQGHPPFLSSFSCSYSGVFASGLSIPRPICAAIPRICFHISYGAVSCCPRSSGAPRSHSSAFHILLICALFAPSCRELGYPDFSWGCGGIPPPPPPGILVITAIEKMIVVITRLK